MRLHEIITEASAFHGSNYDFQEFDDAHVGTGDGANTFGFGIYVSSDRDVARRYRKAKTGYVYLVDVPDHSEMLNWNKTIGEQPPAVKAALERLGYARIRQRQVENELLSDTQIETDSGEDIYAVLSEHNYEDEHHKPPGGSGPEWSAYYKASKKRTSMQLLSAGVAGITYFDVEADRTDISNFCIFDPRRIKITKRGRS